MPAVNDRAKWRGRRPKAAKERTRGKWCAESAAHSAMGIWVTRKVGATDHNGLEGERRRVWWEAEAGVDS
jgi:hypothetical protein